MCGIAGIYHFGNSRPVDETALRSLCNAIKHRGPDDEGIYLTPQIGLGMRRLAVIDLVTGHQPLCNEDKTVWIVFNGEIYNYRQLREQLAPRHTFSTQSDTEVIIHLYEEYGESCVEHLRGMFAFAIWDSRRQCLFFARDRIGKKPLYYAVNNGALVFSSEIPGIIKYLPHKPAIKPSAIDLYLTYQYIPAPHTVFEGISTLLPAHTMTCGRNGEIVTRRYWDIDYRQKTSLSFPEACDRTYDLLRESTRLRMVADVPLGAFLSGGHDSSIIVGLMSQLSSAPVKTFSIGFDESDFSELAYARMVADRFKTDHHEFIVRPHFIDLLPEIARRYGQPFADASALPSYIVARETRKQVTVALNGDGGDEAFGGYTRYQAMKVSPLVSLPFRMIGKTGTHYLAGLIPGTGTARGNNVLRHTARFIEGLAQPPDKRMVRYASLFTDHLKERIYTSSFKNDLIRPASSFLSELFLNSPANTMLDRTFSADIHSYLPDCLLVKIDIATMAHALEARSPFLDHTVLEFSAALPASWKLHGLTTKYLLRKTFDSLLPEAVTRRKKQGFGIPLGKWFRNEWKDYFHEVVLSERAIGRGYFNRSALTQLFQQHTEGKHDHGYCLWALLMLELWHREIYDA